jgi:myo-inositol-1(or 4)-monophosphatase
MPSPEIAGLLELAKATAVRAATRLLESLVAVDRSFSYSAELPREVKAAADAVLEQDILHALSVAGLPILSEESGYLPASRHSNLWFIVDPLDGTFNFVKRLGPSAVSIGLWQDQQPIFGVIYDLMHRQLTWGGAGLGACIDDRPISVSSTSNLAQASITTGFPVRFDLEDEGAMRVFFGLIKPYAKVRMLGSAAASLLYVARGSADVYLEQSIMLWDVAAGLAIVQGAGGAMQLAKTGREWCYDVVAANPALLPRVPRPDSLSIG